MALGAGERVVVLFCVYVSLGSNRLKPKCSYVTWMKNFCSGPDDERYGALRDRPAVSTQNVVACGA